jgi:hypothetical protein
VVDVVVAFRKLDDAVQCKHLPESRVCENEDLLMLGAAFVKNVFNEKRLAVIRE